MIHVAVGNDHRGFLLKKKMKDFLRRQHIAVIDVGAHSDKSCDYPVFVSKVGHLVSEQKVDFGILICKTGIGSAIAANKIKNIRAALCYNIKTARLARQHNNANILVMGADFVKPQRARRIIDEWLKARFQGGRHERRISQIVQLEEGEKL
jgi:ribose 5-phosphate isomerase B